MLTRIYKYSLLNVSRQEILMPEGAKILCIQVQFGVACIWAMVVPSNEVITRVFRTIGTGHEVDKVTNYIGTYQLEQGELIYHVFEE